jgi:adenylate cyclase
LSTIVPSLAARDETNPVIHWLMTEARRRIDPNEFLEAFAHELRAADVDVSRITTGVPILHPQIFSFSGLWELGKGTTERLFRSGPDVAVTMANSPIHIAYQGGGPVSCDLTLPPQQGEFAILEDLRREGFTHYIVHSVPFADASHKALSLATKRPGGFRADETALFAAMIPALAFNLEVQALRRTARTLLDTYVGRQSGAASGRPDSARQRRNHSRRDLAMRPARLHQPVGTAAAGSTDRPAQQLLRPDV